jgi:hypothetical protein
LKPNECIHIAKIKRKNGRASKKWKIIKKMEDNQKHGRSSTRDIIREVKSMH